MTSALLFDIGETILEADAQEDALIEAHMSALGKFGYPLTREEYLRLDNDIIPAKRLGLKTIWVRRGRYRVLEPRTPDELPDATVFDTREIYAAIASLAEEQ